MRNHDERYEALYIAAVQGQSARIADPAVIDRIAHETAKKGLERFTRFAIEETEKRAELAAASAA